MASDAANLTLSLHDALPIYLENVESSTSESTADRIPRLLELTCLCHLVTHKWRLKPTATVLNRFRSLLWYTLSFTECAQPTTPHSPCQLFCRFCRFCAVRPGSTIGNESRLSKTCGSPPPLAGFPDNLKETASERRHSGESTYDKALAFLDGDNLIRFYVGDPRLPPTWPQNFHSVNLGAVA